MNYSIKMAVENTIKVNFEVFMVGLVIQLYMQAGRLT